MNFLDDTTPVLVKWKDFSTWLCTTEVPIAPLKPLRPGMGNRTMTTLDALVLLREQLHFKAMYEATRSSRVHARAGRLRPNEKDGTRAV